MKPDPEALRARRDQAAREREQGHRAADGTLKRPFRTKAAAKKNRKATGHVRVDDLVPYVCFVCGSWHLGNKPGRKW